MVDKLKTIREGLDFLKDHLDSVKDANLKAQLEDMFKNVDYNKLSDEEVKNLLSNPPAAPVISAGFQNLKTDAEVTQLYTDWGIAQSSLPKPLPSSTPAGVTSALDAIQKGDFTGALAAVSKDGKLDPVMIAAVVGGINKLLLGGGVGESAKYGGIAALVVMALNYFGGEKGQGLLGGLGEGADGLMGGIGKMFSGGADGVGGIMGGIGDAFSSITDNPKLKGMMSTVLDFVKDQPLVAAAVGYGLYAMFGNGFSLGGIFSGMSTAMLAMAVAWVAQSFLGIDGKGHSSQIVHDAPAIDPSRLPEPVVKPGDLQVVPG